MRRLAAIDIGTNTVKLLVGDTDGSSITPIHQASIQTRLGKGLQKTRTLSQSSIDHTIATFQSFLETAKELASEHVVANATSAVRDATNGPAFAEHLRETTGVPLRIISGGEEAELVYRGIRSATSAESDQQIIIDVGGGSTEMIVASKDGIQVQKSIDIGSVRLLETLELSEPLSLSQRDAFSDVLVARYSPLVQAAKPQLHSTSTPTMIAAGGGAVAASMLLRSTTEFDPQSIESQPLSLDQLRQLEARLWQTGVEERKSWHGMPRERADIIPLGVAIFVHLLESFEIPQLWVSTRGLRFGLLLKHCETIQAPLTEV